MSVPEPKSAVQNGVVRRLSAHAHIGFESPLTCSNGVGGRFQRLRSAPRHLSYMPGTLQSNGFDHPRPLSGVDTSVVGASGAHAFWWRRTPKSGV